MTKFELQHRLIINRQQTLAHSQMQQPSLILCIVFLVVMLAPVRADNCQNTLVGCVNCTTTFQALNISSNLFICTAIANCQIVDISGVCQQCGNGTILNSVNGTLGCAVASTAGCKSMLEGVCTSCISTAYAFDNTTNTCKLLVFDYCWKTNSSGCIQCSDQNIDSASNCSISSTLCQTFDYQKWVCLACSSTTVLHQSGIFCYDATTMANCLVISTTACLQCKFGYSLNSLKQCVQDTTFTLEYELLPTSYYYNKAASLVRVCLNINSVFTTSCTLVTTGINYCAVASSGICTQCVTSFYLTSNLCKPCQSAYSNCLICDSYNCQQCVPTYFLALQSSQYNISQVISGVNTSVSSCLPCNIYGCYYCRSQYDNRGIFNVRCDKCLFGYKLHNHTCIKCSSGTYFSPTLKVCTPCAVQNCSYCNSNDVACDQCDGSLYFDKTTKTCLDMTSVLTNQTLSSSNAYEILNKSLTLSSTSIVNDQKLLMTNCAGSSNGYACLCTNANQVYSSLCYALSTNVKALTITPASFGFTGTTLTTADLTSNSALLLLLSQLPNFNFVYSPASASELISNDQFANYLQIVTNYIRNHAAQASSSVQALSKLVFDQIYNTFDPYKPTIFSGPGYYFKYTPANPTSDDTTVVSISQTTVASVIYIYFTSTVDSTTPRLTGLAYAFLNQANTAQVNLKIKKISFLGNNEYTTVIYNGNTISLSTSSDSDGFVTISSITTSNTSVVNSYYVSSASNSAIADQFSSQRIQNLIYRVAFIYILIFLFLYLTLIPFCALFDCVDNKASNRKVKTQEEETYQGIKHKTQSDVEDQIALKINYKDFFPIYNIANTDRPRRLVKLCLFLVNSQHSITFLSLIYFHLPAGQPLVAVLLAIPAYICTVIMGYLCGLLTLKIPGKTKYLINLVTIGYWILWIPIMSSFYSYDYSPYVFTFAIIFFFIDMLVDFLQTLLMYFTIKQQSRQIKLFKALSRWLSYRGYYQFDRMAKAIDEIRDT